MASEQSSSTRAEIRSAAAKKAAATRRRQRDATAAQRRDEPAASGKVRIRFLVSSWKLKRGAIRSVPEETAADLVRNGHAVRI